MLRRCAIFLFWHFLSFYYIILYIFNIFLQFTKKSESKTRKKTHISMQEIDINTTRKPHEHKWIKKSVKTLRIHYTMLLTQIPSSHWPFTFNLFIYICHKDAILFSLWHRKSDVICRWECNSCLNSKDNNVVAR